MAFEGLRSRWYARQLGSDADLATFRTLHTASLASPALREGLTAESVERIHPDDMPAYREALVAHLRGETAQFVSEYRYLDSTDTWRWSRQSGIALRRPSPELRAVVGHHQPHDPNLSVRHRSASSRQPQRPERELRPPAGSDPTAACG